MAKKETKAKQYFETELSFFFLIIRFLDPCYPKILGDIPKLYKKQVRLFQSDYIIIDNENEAENDK